MPTRDDSSPAPGEKPSILEQALEKNQEVQDKAEAAAAELSMINEAIRKEITANTPGREAENAVARSESIKEKVQECANDLHEVNEALAEEAGSREELGRELMETGHKLFRTANILSIAQEDLAIAHGVGAEAVALLAREKEYFRITLSCIGDAVITTDISGGVTYLNPVAEAMTGWTSFEAVGLPLPEVFHIINSQTDEIAVNPVEQVLQDKQAAGLALHTLLISRKGERFSISDSAAPIRDRSGELVGVVLVFHDVTHAQKMAMQMTYQASHDALTGLINRREFERRLEIISGDSLFSGRVMPLMPIIAA